ncbi:hypothetical protein IJ818_01185 [bacterium]|nr:hypothetical protein [bacterium]
MTENFNEDMNKNIIEALQKQSQDEEDFDFETSEEVMEEDINESDLDSVDELIVEESPVFEEETAPQIEEDEFSILNDTSEEEPVMEQVLYEETVYDTPQEEPVYETPAYEQPLYSAPHVEETHYESPVYETPAYDSHSEDAHSYDAPAYEQDIAPHAVVEKLADELYQFEIPSNVAVLKKLISQLPSGVTRQTGAQIIKQTMEALGISMKSVLQDAQAVQEKLNNSAKECQATIQEYKRQIATLEEQASSYRKQYNNLNDLVSLFIQH